MEFLQTAEFLSLSGRNESDWRSSISRSYYAIYWMLSREVLKSIPLTLLQNASYAGKITSFMRSYRES